MCLLNSEEVEAVEKLATLVETTGRALSQAEILFLRGLNDRLEERRSRSGRGDAVGNPTTEETAADGIIGLINDLLAGEKAD